MSSMLDLAKFRATPLERDPYEYLCVPGFVKAEHLEAINRVAREATRLTEEAAVEFNAAIRTTREEAARRLSRELDRAIEAFTRQAERVLGERLAEVGQSGGGQIERRLQRQFGITDTGTVLNDIFGAEEPAPAAE